MNPGTITIEGSAIVLSAPSATEIQGVIALFKKLFKVRPTVRIRGYFPAVTGDHPVLNLVDAFYPVIEVGRVYVKVDLDIVGIFSVNPKTGRRVEVRLTLPETKK